MTHNREPHFTSSELPYVEGTLTAGEKLHRKNLEEEVFRIIQEYGPEGYMPIDLAEELFSEVECDWKKFKDQVTDLSSKTMELLQRISGEEANELRQLHQKLLEQLSGPDQSTT